MADQFRLPPSPYFPARLPARPEEMMQWAETMQETIRQLYRLLADRHENVLTGGLLADRPAADGTIRFYFATDDSPPTLYYDNGTWNAV